MPPFATEPVLLKNMSLLECFKVCAKRMKNFDYQNRAFNLQIEL